MSKLNRYRASKRDINPSSFGHFFNKKRSTSLDDNEEKEDLIRDEQPSRLSFEKISIEKSSRESMASDDLVSVDDGPVPGSCCGPDPWTIMDWTIFLLKISIYVVGQVLSIMIEFGAVFFVISLLYLIWSSLDDRKRAKNEPSAYSVFNPGFKEIRGTVNAKQLQAELTFGAFHNY